MSQHTPGPWVVNDEMSRAHHRYEGGTRVVSSAEGDIAICETTRGWEDPGTSPANAHLIAAAPDLYRQLAHLVHLIEPLERDGHNIPGLATLNAARAALAKAEGKP